MRFMVNWTLSAVDQLAAAWVSAPDRRAVTAASHRIERRLRVDHPERLGEDFYGDRL